MARRPNAVDVSSLRVWALSDGRHSLNAIEPKSDTKAA
jgi:hypothetical protein